MIIPVNRKRSPIVLLAGILILIVLGITVTDRLTHFNEAGYNNNVLAALIGLTLSIFVFTTLTFLEYVKTVFDKNATLSITDQCITDQLSIFSVGNISWSDILEIKITPALKTEFLVIAVTDPQLFIARKNRLKRRPLRSFLKRFGSPIVISQKRIDYNLHDLKDILLMAKPA